MMRFTRVVLVLAVAVALGACGGYHMGGGADPSPASPTTRSPGLGFDVVATERDRTATLRVGQKLELVLHATGGMADWTGVKSSDASVLVPIVNPAATAARGVTLAAFQAKAPGEATVTAYAGALCSPGEPCPMLLAAYTLQVTVTG